MKIILIIFLLLFICSCKEISNNRNEININKIFTSNKKFALIQSNKDKYIIKNREGNFGDIYVYNFENRSFERITDDNDYEEWLTWSPDGSKLLFSSTRETIQAFSGDKYNYTCRLFTYDFKNKTISKFTVKPSLNFVYDFVGLSWTSSGVYFADCENIICKVNHDGDSLRKILQLDDSISVDDLSISPNDKLIAFGCHNKNKGFEFGIGLYNKNEKTLRWVKNTREILSIGGWNSESNSFIIRGLKGLMIYNIQADSISLIDIPDNHIKYNLLKCVFLNNEEFLCTSCEPIKDIHNYIPRIDVGILNIKDKSYKVIINNKRQKNYLSLFMN